MRHKVAGKRLGRSPDHRKALRRNLINELFHHERIKTTEAKARAIRGEAEKMITIAKRGIAHPEKSRAVHARRLLLARLNNREIVAKVFDELAPRYAERPGGYTRMYKLGLRNGDRAKMALLELVEADEE
jgi:large subunit ribosomal protein L17